VPRAQRLAAALLHLERRQGFITADRVSPMKLRTVACAIFAALAATTVAGQIGSERAIAVHLRNGQEFELSTLGLIRFGERLFTAAWTSQDGGGRPLTKGTGAPLADPGAPLVFPRNFNRLSGPDMNSCSGCHNKPIVGGGGEIGANVFVLAQRFDFATFDPLDGVRTRGTADESGLPVTLQAMANSRKTIAMSGAGFIEMLARQMTQDLQAIRDATAPGTSRPLVSKGVSFGTIARRSDGTWDTSPVQGLPAPSLLTSGASAPPTLAIRPFHQAGNVISLRQFTNNAYNHHHGIQSEERFGTDVDADGDGFVNELTRADVTAVTIFQATLPVPGRVISRDPEIREAVRLGELRFNQVGCATCHIASLPLGNQGWIFTEPNPFNPPGNLQVGQAPTLSVDLTSEQVPPPHLKPVRGIVSVPAYTDLKLHDITSGPDDPNREGLDMNQPAGSPAFFAGNSKFITRKLWGIANQHSFGHHGLYTTLREAVLAHGGEAAVTTARFQTLPEHEQNALIEFLKSLQILPPGTRSLCVDDRGEDTSCPSPGDGGRDHSLMD
jgi:Di-haem oxidoreductase, putative peroxidase